MNTLIIGASTGLGYELTELFAKSGNMLYLVSSCKEDLLAITSDLKIRYGVDVFYEEVDLREFSPVNLINNVLNAMGTLDNLLLIAGYGSSDPILTDVEVQAVCNINFTSQIRIINESIKYLTKNKITNIIGIGSVATIRGRGNNMVYASSKRGFEFYFESLLHYLNKTTCKIQFYRMGYLNTNLLKSNPNKILISEPNIIALKIYKNINKNVYYRYMPSWWHVISLFIRIIPRPIFKKLNF